MAELTLDECLDLLRSLHGRMVKPFEKLPQMVESAADILKRQLPAAKKELENLTRSISDLKAEMPTLERDTEAARQRATVAIKDAQEAEGAARSAMAETESRAQDRDVALTKQFDDKRNALEAEYAAAVDTLGAEIEGLERKKAELEREVAVVREKFRGL